MTGHGDKGAPARVGPRGSAHLQAPRILLVMAAESDRQRYASAFRARGYCTLQAATVADACRLAAELTPAAVVADVALSVDGDGVPLVRRLRQDIGVPQVPTVILAGGRTPAVQGALETAGADLFVVPPGNIDRVVAAVSSLMRPAP